MAAASLALTAGVGLAAAPGASAAAPSAIDQTFMTKNAQSNLAEITLAGIAADRAQGDATKQLGQKTLADHQKALSQLQAVAKQEGVTLPTAPNPQQQADAAQLKSVAADQFDLQYNTVQVTGHQLSIADTNTELSSGSDAATISFARTYLPVAQMHLDMATQNVIALGGTVPGQVPAGTGGQRAAADASGSTTWLVELGAGAALAAGGVLVLRRTRRRDEPTG